MTEPPRPPGDDPTTPYHSPGGFPPPPYTPPASGPGDYPPPPYTPPTSDAGKYPPPPPGYGPSGYGPPGYGPPGYGPPGYGPPGYGPPGYGNQPANSEDRVWILAAHFGGAAGVFIGGGFAGWIAPLIALLARGNQSPVVRAEAVKALNFQILWLIISVIGYVLILCAGLGVVVVGAAWLIATVVGVIAGVKAAGNQPFNYPMTYSFLR